LDIRSYTWVDRFVPEPKSSNTNPSTTTTPSASANSQSHTMKILIGTIIGILGIAIFIAIGIFGYKWHKNKPKKLEKRIRPRIEQIEPVKHVN